METKIAGTHRRWSITTFVTKEQADLPETDLLELLGLSHGEVKFGTGQIELCPTTGRYHFQGAVSMRKSMRLTGMRKIFTGAHLEPARDWDQLLKYVTKEETRYRGSLTTGELQQGKRSDLQEAAHSVAEGKSLREIAAANPSTFVRYHKGLAALKQTLQPPRHQDRRVALFVGPTATGKTRSVFDYLDDVYTVFCTKSPWFDGYTGQRTALLDECGPGMMNHNFLKRLLDRYPITVPVKGGAESWSADCIVLTSNVDLETWYPGLPLSDFNALKRRIEIFQFPGDKKKAIEWLRCRGKPVMGLVPTKRERESTADVVDVETESEEDEIVMTRTWGECEDLTRLVLESDPDMNTIL